MQYKVMHVVCIDVGIINMGVVCVNVDESRPGVPHHPFTLKVNRLERVDITSFDEKVKELAHRMRLFFDHFQKEFDEADHILVERQPLCGCIAVQELILYRFPEKTEFLSPSQMHRCIKIQHLTYEERKVATVFAARHLLCNHTRALAGFEALGRKHDVADAICLLYFWLVRSKEHPFEKFNYKKQK